MVAVIIENITTGASATTELLQGDNVFVRAIDLGIALQGHEIRVRVPGLPSSARTVMLGSGPWDPSNVPNVLGWLDAANAASFDTPTGAITTWSPRRGTMSAAATGTARPTRGGSQNGNAFLTFDGVANRLTVTGGPTFGVGVTIFAVTRPIVTPNTTTAHPVLSRWGNPRVNGDWQLDHGYDTRMMLRNNSATYECAWGDPTTTWGLRYGTVEAGGMHIATDGLGRKLLAYGGTTPASAATCFIGGSMGGFSNIEVGEIIVLSQAPSDATRQRIEGYLAWKWGTVAKLAADHPYKLKAPLLGDDFTAQLLGVQPLPWAGYGAVALTAAPVEVPVGATSAVIRLTAGGPIQKTCSAHLVRALNDPATNSPNVGTGSAYLPSPNHTLYWRPGDDADHYITIPIPSGAMAAAGRSFKVEFRTRGFASDSGFQVTITAATGVTNALPNPLPFHRAPRRIDFTGATPKGVIAPATDNWSDTGYAGNAASGTGILQARLAHGYAQIGNGENGLYANSSVPGATTSPAPQSRGTDTQGRSYIRLHTEKYAAPVADPTDVTSTYPFQASAINGIKRDDLCTRRGVFRAQLVTPSRNYAWSAFWCIGRKNGNDAWPTEIDFFEHFNKVYDNTWNNTNFTSSGQHYGPFGSNNRVGASTLEVRLLEFGLADVNVTTEIHDYSCLIEDDVITWFLDGYETDCQRNVVDHDKGITGYDFFPILNVAVKAPSAASTYADGSGDMLVYGMQTYAAGSGYTVTAYNTARPWANAKITPDPTGI